MESLVSQAAARVSLRPWLILGRVSNLPTVWSNSLVGLALGGFLSERFHQEFELGWSLVVVLGTMFVMSLFYVGGMLLNDAFDASIDMKERPERPIPSGQVSRTMVFVVGFGLLLTGVLGALGLASTLSGNLSWVLSSAVALAGCIVLYNIWHKSNPISPLIMGLCRVLVYLTAALLLVTEPNAQLLWASAGLLGYLIGLTAIAKQENLSQVSHLWPLGFLCSPVVIALFVTGPTIVLLVASGGLIVWILYAFRLLVTPIPGNIPKAVSAMLAGISLVDAIVLSALVGSGIGAIGLMNPLGFISLFWIVICLICFGMTLLFQRVIPGT